MSEMSEKFQNKRIKFDRESIAYEFNNLKENEPSSRKIREYLQNLDQNELKKWIIELEKERKEIKVEHDKLVERIITFSKRDKTMINFRIY